MKKVTRIKYTNRDGILTSNCDFLGNEGTVLFVTIDTRNSNVVVRRAIEPGVSDVVEAMPYTTINKGKLIGKQLLKKYGVVFFEEVRRKKVKEVTEVA